MRLLCLMISLVAITTTVVAQESNTMIIDWGDNTNNQLDAPFNESSTTEVSSGYIHTLTLENGEVLSFGGNVNGQTTIPTISQPVIAISAGFSHSMVLLEDSTVVAWGGNSHGQASVPDTLQGVTMIGAGEIHSIALLDSGRVIAWGDNSFGQTDVSDTVVATFISAGNFHNLAILTDSTVFAWGKNDFGQTDIPTISEKIIDIAAGEYHSVALSENGNVFAWGDNTLFGQTNVPSSIQGNVIDIEAGNHHTIALLADSTLAVWGSSTFNQGELPELFEGRKVSYLDAGYSYNTTVATNLSPSDITLSTYEVRENPDAEEYYIGISSEDNDNHDFHKVAIAYQPSDIFGITGLFAGYSNDLIYDRLELGEYYHSLFSQFEFDYETQKSHRIILRATDLGGLTYDEEIEIKVIDINEAPDSVLLDSTYIFESQPIGTVIGNFSTYDPDSADTHTYSLSTGPGSLDNGFFSVKDNELRSNHVFNYSERQSYLIRVRSTDSGGLHKDENFVITIEDINNAPTEITLDNNEIYSGLPSGTFIGAFDTEDLDETDTHTYTFTDSTGSQNERFSIVSGKLYSNDIFEADESSITITVTSTDSGEPTFSVTQNLEIEIIPANQSPTDITLSNSEVNKLADPGLVIGLLAANDPDSNDQHNFELVNGDGNDHNANYRIEGNKLILTTDISTYDQDTMSVRIKATDNGSPSRLSIEKQFTLSIFEASDNNPPSSINLSNNTITENNSVGTLVGMLSATDPDDNETFIYSMGAASNSDNNAFYIENDQLLAAETFDFEVKNNYQIDVIVQDQAGATLESIFSVSITDSSDSPTNIELANISIEENNLENDLVSEILITDDDESTYTITVFGDDGNTSTVFYENDEKLYVSQVLDFEEKSQYDITIEVQDGSVSIERLFTIFVINEDEAPTGITLDNTSINEAAASGTVIGTFTVIDEDLAFSNTLAFESGDGDDDNGSFEIDGALLKLNDTLNFDTKNEYFIRVSATAEDGTKVSENFTIDITEENLDNLSPEALILNGFTAEENVDGKQFVGVFIAIDPDDTEDFIYYLSEGNGDDDNSSFMIEGDSLFATTTFNFEEKYVYSIRATVQDNDGESYSQSYYINVTDVNESPTDIFVSTNLVTVNENRTTFIAYLETEDEDNNQTFTYSLEEGIHFNDFFKILNGDELWAEGEVNTLNEQTILLQIESVDNGNPTLSISKELELIVSKPPNILSTYFSVNESAEANHAIGEILTDSEGSFLYEISSGNTDDVFSISPSTGLLSLAKSETLNFDEIPKYQLGIQVTNENNLSSISVIEVDVIPVDRPTVNAGFFTISEDSEVGSEIGEVNVISSSPEDLSFQIISGNDQNTFSVTGGIISIGAELDYESTATYELLIGATTPLGFYSEALYIINISNANDAPFEISLDNNSLREKQPSGTIVGRLSVRDEDTSDEHTYTVSDPGNFFRIEDGTLLVNNNILFENNPSITITVEATDNGSPNKSVSQEFEIQIESLPSVTIPNAFSPDGNGINDRWVVENLDLYFGNVVEVHNQQGVLVYSNADGSTSWDGTFNGDTLPVGNYYYYIRLSSENVLTGIVTIIK